MTSKHPITQIKHDRTDARRLDDPNADICFLALCDQDGKATVRTLVLREIRDNHFLVFMSRSSPKWQILTGGGSYQLLLWYPTMQRQYRISGTMEFVDDTFVKTSWLRRPRGSKLLDLYYEYKGDQSSLIDSRATLVDRITELRQTFELDDLEAPTKVAGIELVASEIEMLDLNREDRIHDRQLFRLVGDDWVSQYLVP